MAASSVGQIIIWGLSAKDLCVLYILRSQDWGLWVAGPKSYLESHMIHFRVESQQTRKASARSRRAFSRKSLDRK